MAEIKKIFREPEPFDPLEPVPTWVLKILIVLMAGYCFADYLSKTV